MSQMASDAPLNRSISANLTNFQLDLDDIGTRQRGRSQKVDRPAGFLGSSSRKRGSLELQMAVFAGSKDSNQS